MKKIKFHFKAFFVFAFVLSIFSSIFAQNQVPSFLKDPGTGIASSMFGTYIREGEFLFYSYYEYYHDQDAEYKPAELG